MDEIKRAQLQQVRDRKARTLEDVRLEAEVLQAEIDAIDAELTTEAPLYAFVDAVNGGRGGD